MFQETEYSMLLPRNVVFKKNIDVPLRLLLYFVSENTQCKISWNSCQDLGFSRKFPLPLETLDKILNYLGPLKNLEILEVKKTACSKSVIIYAFHQTPTRSVRMERILFIIKFPAETWKNIEDEIREIFQTFFGAKWLNQIDNVVTIQNKVWYQMTYRLF